jgi:RES domain-containing protein
VILWRFTRHQSLDGRGGLLVSGRWHSRGHEILYCAPNPSTALLEVLVHSGVSQPSALGDFRFLKIEVPDELAGDRIADARLPTDWSSRQDLTRSLGDQWLRTAATPLLWVRSALVPETFNALVNPNHPDSARIVLLEVIAFPLDQRLLV